MLKCLFAGSAVAAADDQHGLGRIVRGERGVDKVFVVIEFVPLGCHEAVVEAEQLAELRCVVNF